MPEFKAFDGSYSDHGDGRQTAAIAAYMVFTKEEIDVIETLAKAKKQKACAALNSWLDTSQKRQWKRLLRKRKISVESMPLERKNPAKKIQPAISSYERAVLPRRSMFRKRAF